MSTYPIYTGSSGYSYSGTTISASSNYSTSTTVHANKFHTTSGTQVFTISDGKPAALNVTGDIKMNGESLEARLTRIETMLYIPQRKLDLEEKYERLRNAWALYQEAADACKNWELLKGDD